MVLGKRTICALLLSALVSIFTGCGSSRQVCGTITEISSSAITISIQQADSNASKEETYPLSGSINTENLVASSFVKLTIQDQEVTAIEAISANDLQEEFPKKSAVQKGIYTVAKDAVTLKDKNIEAASPNESAILIQGKKNLTLQGGTFTKFGDTSDLSKSLLQGLNSILAASNNSSVSITDATFTSSAKGACAIFATGEKTSIQAEKFKIYTTGSSSAGITSAYNSSISAVSGDITTKGAGSAPFLISTGSGTIQAKDTSISTEGTNSPCMDISGTFTASQVTGSASGSPILICRGNSNVTLKNCLLQGGGKYGILFYKSSPESEEDTGNILTVADSKLTTTSEGPMFYALNTNCHIILKNTDLYYSNPSLIQVSGCSFTLKAVRQSLKGNIRCRSSQISIKLTEGSVLQSAVNGDNTADSASVSLDKSSIWEVTGNSYLTQIFNQDKSCKNIQSHGHTVYYNSQQNPWLKGKSVLLPGGGTLKPAN